MTEEAVISAFSDGVRDIKMKEELAIHEDLCTSLELFNLATKCARAEVGCLSLLELPAADPEENKLKAKGVERKGAVVLAPEPDPKRGRDQPEPSKGGRYCVYHDLHTHNTNKCQSRRPSGLRKTIDRFNSLAHRTTWLRSDFELKNINDCSL